MGDWTSDAPGVRRKITVADLPAPSSNVLAINMPRVVDRPADAQLRVPPGFKIDPYVGGFRDPRFLLTAPNGDIFATESRANQIKVLRDTKNAGKPDVTEVFAERDLNKPFGIAFYPPGNDPQFLYVANTDGIIRFPYPGMAISKRAVSRKIELATFRWRSPSARRRTLDTRHRFFARWQENVCLNRLALE
jgi:glucose/arabinose dehydrogenase